MDDDKVILKISGHMFYMDMAEAITVAKILCSVSRIKEARVTTDDWGNVLAGPEIDSVSIQPMTAHYWLQLEANRKAKEEREAKK
jgi:orotate phosphoribosyltransferase